MKIDHVTINGSPVQVAAVIDVTSPFTAGWTTDDVAAYQKATGTVTMTDTAWRKMRRLYQGQHLPKRLRRTVGQ